MYDMLDALYAELFEVTVEEYVSKIESLSDYIMDIVLNAILSEDAAKVTKAIRIFKLIK